MTPSQPTTPELSGVQTLTLAKAINAGLDAAMAADDSVLMIGEDIGKLGGVFRVTDGLQAKYGEPRVIDSPLAESGIVGAAIGLALRGYRPVCEIQFDGFIFPAFDQITTQLAKLHARSKGRLQVPIVIRVPFGGGIGAVEHHSESPEVLFAYTAGLRVVSPSTPADAYLMLQEAIASPDPVLFFEPKGRYWEKGSVDLDVRATPASDAPDAAPGTACEMRDTLNRAVIRRPGTDLTLVGYGPTVHTCMQVAEVAAGEGKSIEVIDLRSISPLDWPTVAESVRMTGRCVIVHEASTAFGPGAELAARISEECFFDLEAPVLRVGGFHSPYPPSKLEHDFLPDLDRVLDAVDRSLAI